MIRTVAVIDSQTGRAVRGVVTCAIQRSGWGQRVFALSCRHVFSLSKILHGRLTHGTVSVGSVPSSNIIGETTAVRGELRRAPEFSFDAQLSAVTNLAALRVALGQVRFGGHAKYVSDLPARAWIATARGWVPGVNPTTILGNDTRANYSEVLPLVVHRQLLRLTVADSSLINGDSGGPVVSENGTFLGMYIAGISTTAYLIPAWQLISPSNFAGTASSETWALLNI